MSDVQKVTFFQRKQIVCPVCEAKFHREDVLSGGGRLIAGVLSEELRRVYEPSKKYGGVYPLIYPVTVCPTCNFAAYPQDFSRIPPERIKDAEHAADDRREGVSLIFPELDFTSARTLKEGVASYFFALSCYPFFNKGANPTFKSGLSALRAAWLLMDLHAASPAENYDSLASLFYKKARAFYLLTLEKEQKGAEPLTKGLQLGPDLDKDYGYDGLIYLAGYLDYKYGADGGGDARIESLEFAKRTIAKVFGVGKVSRDKPSTLLDQAKRIYEQIGQEVSRLKGEVPGKTGEDGGPG